MNNIQEKLHAYGIIPVVAIEDAKSAAPLGEALLAGGLPCAELTFRTAAAAEAIRNMSQAFPEILIGAGTVLTVEQAEAAVEAGATYILAPGFDPEIVAWCQQHNVLVIPGIMTPTDITAAIKMGVRLLKFFPAAAAGGPTLLKSMSDPFKGTGVKFVPTGGVGAHNLADFLQMPNVVACGGSWLVKKHLISDGNFAEVTRLTQEAVEIVKEIRD